MEFMQNLDYAEQLTEEEADSLYYGNYRIKRNPGDKATGEVVLRFNKIPTESQLLIPSGVYVSTNEGLRFVTTTNIRYSPEELYAFYNPTMYLYEIPVPVVAEDVGTKYRVGAGVINKIETQFHSGLVGVVNKTATVGGTDKESNADYANRIRNYYISRHLGTKPGYKEFILENFPEIKDVYTAGYRDPLMMRDIVGGRHIGGKVDLYIRGGNIEIKTDQVTFRGNKLPLSKDWVQIETIRVLNATKGIDDLEYEYTVNESSVIVLEVPELDSNSVIQWDDEDVIEVRYKYTTNNTTVSHTDSFILGKTKLTLSSPFINIVSITNVTKDIIYDESEEGLYNLEYLVEDELIGTSREEVVLEIIKTDIENGDVISISYNYNKSINKIEEVFNKEQHRIITTDILTKSAAPIYIYIKLAVKLKSGNTPDPSKESIIRTAIAEYLDNIPMGGNIEESDIVAKLYNNKNIETFLEYVSLPFDVFLASEDPNVNINEVEDKRSGTYVELGTIEYPVLQLCDVQFVNDDTKPLLS